MPTDILPPKLAGNASVQRISRALTMAKASNKVLREEAQNAQTPMDQTLSIQGGIAGAALIAAFVPEDKVAMAQGAASAASLAVGLWQGSPRGVAAANGLASNLSYQGWLRLFKKARNKSDSETVADSGETNQQG